jgi:hypothetical protein
VESQPQYVGAQILQGWIELTCGRESNIQKSISFFDKALSGNKKEIEVVSAKRFVHFVSRLC